MKTKKINLTETKTKIEDEIIDDDKEKELIEYFEYFDKEKKGYISADYLKDIMMNQGDKLTEEEANEMINEVGVDEKGFIDYRKLVKKLLQ